VIRIGLVGPGRRRNGTGPFLAEALVRNGAQLRAVVSSTTRSARRAAEELFRRLGQTPQVSESVGQMARRQDLDAFVIASPHHTHWSHLEQLQWAGRPIYCEKPLVTADHTATAVQRLTERLEASGAGLFYGAQWPYALPALSRIIAWDKAVGPGRLDMVLSPGCVGPEAFWEAMPHAVSLLVAWGARPPVLHGQARWSRGGGELTLTFHASNQNGGLVEAHITLRTCPQQPRPMALAVDGQWVYRRVRLDPYRATWYLGDAPVAIPDPLPLAVDEFVRRTRHGTVQALHPAVVRNVALLQELAQIVLHEARP